MSAFPNAVRQFGAAAFEARAAPPATVTPLRTHGRRRHPGRRVVVRLWLPTTAIFCILAPIPLLAAPLAWLAPAGLRPANPYAAVLAVGHLLIALGGTVVDVDTPDALVRIRLF